MFSWRHSPENSTHHDSVLSQILGESGTTFFLHWNLPRFFPLLHKTRQSTSHLFTFFISNNITLLQDGDIRDKKLTSCHLPHKNLGSSVIVLFQLPPSPFTHKELRRTP
jgi:hypothetical protein